VIKRLLTLVVETSAALALLASPAPRAQERAVAERVDVARVLIDARVLDDRGQPVLGLGPEAFEVKIDGRSVRVETAEWIDPETRHEGQLTSTASTAALLPRGRLIVFLVQKSLESGRAVGLLQWPQIDGPLLDRLTPSDRVAVLSFDSHLKIWLDFTSDSERIRRTLARDVMFEQPAPIEPGPEPSLTARLTQRDGRRIYTIEKALKVLGDALEPLAGSKSVILVGYGFDAPHVGAPRSGGLRGTALAEDGYEAARLALQRARASVFCLDITQADYHTLESGLQTLAADTGGFFARMFFFPQQAIDRVADALTGHYVLFVEKPELRSGVHRIAVRMTGRAGTVLARSAYTD